MKPSVKAGGGATWVTSQPSSDMTGFVNTLESFHGARIYVSWALQARQACAGSPRQKVRVIAALGGLCSFPAGMGESRAPVGLGPCPGSWNPSSQPAAFRGVL